jgi:hypothetical protein
MFLVSMSWSYGGCGAVRTSHLRRNQDVVNWCPRYCKRAVAMSAIVVCTLLSSLHMRSMSDATDVRSICPCLLLVRAHEEEMGFVLLDYAPCSRDPDHMSVKVLYAPFTST